MNETEKKPNAQTPASEKSYEAVEIFGHPALFSNMRENADTMPQSAHLYHLRGSDYDPGLPVFLEHRVGVNHAGTIIVSEPIDLGERGFRSLKRDGGLNFMGYEMTVSAYLEAMKQRAIEEEFLAHPDDAFAIYQLKRDDATFDYRFEPMERLEKLGLRVDRANYDLVHIGQLPPARKHNTQTHLNTLFEQFNYDRPADFRGHSMSVSDVIALKLNGRVSCHYVDRWGFQELADFLKDDKSIQSERPSVVEQIRQKPDKPPHSKVNKSKNIENTR